MRTVFVDTGAWIALLDRRDRWHGPVAAHFQRLREVRVRLVTSNYVVDETATHLRYEMGLPAALRWHAALEAALAAGSLDMLWVDEPTEAEGWRLLAQFADVALSLTDATSAVLAHAGRIPEIRGLDRDFEALGLTVLPGSRR